MGSYDGAEACELVGLFLLSKLEHLGLNIGLYHNDALEAANLDPAVWENTKKMIFRKVTYFIPPWRSNVRTNIVKTTFHKKEVQEQHQAHHVHLEPPGPERPLHHHHEHHGESILLQPSKQQMQAVPAAETKATN